MSCFVQYLNLHLHILRLKTAFFWVIFVWKMSSTIDRLLIYLGTVSMWMDWLLQLDQLQTLFIGGCQFVFTEQPNTKHTATLQCLSLLAEHQLSSVKWRTIGAIEEPTHGPEQTWKYNIKAHLCVHCASIDTNRRGATASGLQSLVFATSRSSSSSDLFTGWWRSRVTQQAVFWPLHRRRPEATSGCLWIRCHETRIWREPERRPKTLFLKLWIFLLKLFTKYLNH